MFASKAPSVAFLPQSKLAAPVSKTATMPPLIKQQVQDIVWQSLATDPDDDLHGTTRPKPLDTSPLGEIFEDLLGELAADR